MFAEIIAFHEMVVHEGKGGGKDDEGDDNGDDDIRAIETVKVNRISRVRIIRPAYDDDRIEVIEKHPYRDRGKKKRQKEMFLSFLVTFHWRSSLCVSNTLV